MGVVTLVLPVVKEIKMTQKIVCKKHVLDLDARSLIEAELPILKTVYDNASELNFDIAEWLEYYIKHDAGGVSVYHMSEEVGEGIRGTLTEYYHFMLAGLTHLFSKSNAEILKYYPCDMIRKHGDVFLDYAKSEFYKAGAMVNTIGGRFDAAVDPNTGKVVGVYEFNGDTPVMLFESVNLQNLFSTQITGSPDNQINDWWERSIENFSGLKDRNVAVLCDVNFVEDSTTSETVAQMFEATGANVFFTDVRDLVYDPQNMSVPFYIEGSVNVPDYIFILLAWEEMVQHAPEIIANHRFWGPHLRMLEPAWRWFMSHKGFMAFLSDWLKNPEVAAKWGHLPHLESSLSKEQFGGTYVEKPVHGRLSQNIKIVVDGKVAHETVGEYPDTPKLYQKYQPPFKLGDGRNFIVGGWVTGGMAAPLTEVSTLCFREFDTGVLDLKNERFISHVLD